MKPSFFRPRTLVSPALLWRRRRCTALGLVLAAAAVSTTGCSSATSPNAARTYDGASSATFAAYCTGTLKNDMPLMTEEGGGEWESNGALTVNAGSPFLLATNLSQWNGFVIASDGTPYQIDDSTGLVEGTDFTSACVPATMPGVGQTLFVVLAQATLYPNAAFTGTPCIVTAGTELASATFTEGTASGAVSSTSLAAKCSGATTLYTRELPFGNLIAK